MRTLGLILLASAATAAAQPRPKPAPIAFDRTTSFQSCHTSWMFACGMRDAGGHTYGTAKERTSCTRYTFQPNGTFASTGDMIGEHGTYTLRGAKVTLTVIDADPGIKLTPFDLVLSADGEKLGDMTRQLQ